MNHQHWSPTLDNWGVKNPSWCFESRFMLCLTHGRSLDTNWAMFNATKNSGCSRGKGRGVYQLTCNTLVTHLYVCYAYMCLPWPVWLSISTFECVSMYLYVHGLNIVVSYYPQMLQFEQSSIMLPRDVTVWTEFHHATQGCYSFIWFPSFCAGK